MASASFFGTAATRAPDFGPFSHTSTNEVVGSGSAR